MTEREELNNNIIALQALLKHISNFAKIVNEDELIPDEIKKGTIDGYKETKTQIVMMIAAMKDRINEEEF